MSDIQQMSQSDLDRLAQRVEKAAALVQQLRDERDKAVRERDEWKERLQALEQKLQGQDAGSVVHELAGLRKEQREWTAERREVASRIEALVSKLERLDG
jgi:predicted  nucleic acid-binding Zn-ribbon protein